MNEQKISKKLERFILQHPYCCFCGGNVATASIDHVPSRQMFVLKHRPKGLEFPACINCNEKTSSHELVAALISRIFPNTKNDKEKKEIGKLMNSVDKNRHGLLQEMMPSWLQQYDFYKLNHSEKPKGGGALNAKGPLLNKSMQVFGTKLCLALHYHHSQKIVPIQGGVGVRWFSNWEALTGKLPERPPNLFQGFGTLSQGKWSVSEQFVYEWNVSDEGDLGIYAISFRKSFLIYGFVSFDINFFEESDELTVNRPGIFYF